MERLESERNLIVIVVEGLSTNLISGYGSNIARTPTIDQIGARGLMLDQCFVDSPALGDQLRSLWTGRHALQSTLSNTGETLPTTLWDLLSESGQAGCLITDSEFVAQSADGFGCNESILVEASRNEKPVETVFDSGVTSVFAAAAEELIDASRKGLIWLHSRGLRLPWDAPLPLRDQFADPEDPEPPREVGPPSFEITDQTDPDLVTGWGQVAAAQVAVVDEAISAIQAVIESRDDADSWSWCILSLGGVPLGEEKLFGWRNDASDVDNTLQPQLTENQLAVAAILASADASGIGARRSELFQLPDLFHTALNLLQGEHGNVAAASDSDTTGLALKNSDASVWGSTCLERRFSSSPQDWAAAHQLAAMQDADGQVWIRSPAWSARLCNEQAELYVKPDDRWEVSDVASRRPDILRMLKQAWVNFELAAMSGNRNSLQTLDEELTQLIR